MHPEILKWPNSFFYNNRLQPIMTNIVNDFPIDPFQMISYGNVKQMENVNIMLIIDVLLGYIDPQTNSVGIICTSLQQKSIMQNRLKWFLSVGKRSAAFSLKLFNSFRDHNHRYITTSSADESHLVEKDVIIIWISKAHGLSHLCNQTLFNRAVTRAKQSLLICGADLMSYKVSLFVAFFHSQNIEEFNFLMKQSRPTWKSLLENAQQRKCFHHIKNVLRTANISNILRKKCLNNWRETIAHMVLIYAHLVFSYKSL